MKHILPTTRTLGTLGQKTRKMANRLSHTPTVTPSKRDGWII